MHAAAPGCDPREGQFTRSPCAVLAAAPKLRLAAPLRVAVGVVPGGRAGQLRASLGEVGAHAVGSNGGRAPWCIGVFDSVWSEQRPRCSRAGLDEGVDPVAVEVAGGCSGRTGAGDLGHGDAA